MAVTKTLPLAVLSFFLLSIAFSLLTSASEPTKTATPATAFDDDDEDLSFLEEPKPPKDFPDYADPSYHPDGEEAEYASYKAWDNRHAPPSPTYDEKDVVVLNQTNFADFVITTKHVMVEFYAPWCGYCQALVPEYAAAATQLKDEGSDVVLAKVDAIAATELADQYKVDGFPAIYLFSDGKHQPYEGERTKDAIISWLKKKTGFAVQNVSTTEEAEKIIDAEPTIVVAFVDNLTGPASDEINAGAQVVDDVNFYQTTCADVAQIFEIDPKVKRPALVLLKKEVEKLSQFDGNFSKSAIVEFVSTNKHPLVINFSRQSVEVVFEDPLKKQVLLFAPATESAKYIPSLQEVAKTFKQKIMFVYVDSDNEDYGKAMLDHFGIVGDAPKVVAYAGNTDGRKFLLDGDITLDKIKLFCENFLTEKLQPYYKSEPVPDTNDGDVKIVVGKNFEEIVLDESKDVLLQIYAPWCPHCHQLEPTYNRLGRHLRSVDSVVVAKMDGTRNEHPKAKSDGFPTILFFPAEKKSSDPILVESDRTAVALYKFLKKHATILFKVQKPVEAPISKVDKPALLETVTTSELPASSHEINDEL